MENLFDSFRRNAEELGIDAVLSSADVIVVGFSGGADSTALLHLLRGCYADAEIHALHVNHKIRGESAERDEAHCRELCGELGITFVLRTVDVPAEAKRMKLGLEEAARRLRYSAFDEYLCGLDSEGRHALVATAHNADDNLETMIFNLARGSGTRGLCGIAPIRGRYVRPVLCYTSAEIRDFCTANGFAFVTDETNADTKYTRNLIRSEVIPHLRSINPSCARSALSASLLVRRDDDYLNSLAACAIGDTDACSASAEILRNLDDSVLSRALLAMYSNARGGRKDFGGVHLESCIRLIRTSDSGELSLPGRMTMKLSGGKVAFAARGESAADPIFSQTLPVSADEIRGSVHTFPFPNAGFCVALSDSALPAPKNPSDCENIYKISIHTTISFDKIRGSISVRNRLPGDRIVMGGMTRRLKKLFNSAHTENRGSVPVFCDESGILYVPGIGLRDGACDGAGDIRISYWR